jgi:hypothetical protein
LKEQFLVRISAYQNLRKDFRRIERNEPQPGASCSKVESLRYQKLFKTVTVIRSGKNNDGLAGAETCAGEPANGVEKEIVFLVEQNKMLRCRRMSV